MDLSKLPKLSQSNRPDAVPNAAPSDPPDAPPPLAQPRTATHVYAQEGTPRAPAEVGGAAEAWISAIVGLVFLYLGQRFGGWLLATLTGRTYNSGYNWQSPHPQAGQMVPYWSVDPQIYSALSDCALWVFGLALLLEAAVLLLAGGGRWLRPAAATAMVVTALATLLNIATVIYFFQRGLGLALMSVLAVAFGGYMCLYLWRLWTELTEFRHGR